jgi:hypothetical protein
MAGAALSGTFALHGGKAMVTPHVAYSVDAGTTQLDIWQGTLEGDKPILHYTADMTKLMHMIAISEDFTQFIHVHPAFNATTGHFTQALTLDPKHRYYVYTDSVPTGMSQQVFRYTIPAIARIAPFVPHLRAPGPLSDTSGPYAVTLASTTFKADTMEMIGVTITRGGKPATDLKPYLGAAAHAVFINTSTLDYIHVHPMVQGAMMNSSSMNMDMPMDDEHGMGMAGPKLMMHVPALPAGTYRLWLQFEGGGELRVAAFTIAVR